MLLAIDKPHGRTSYDCIRYIKKQFPGQKIGHAGTLDPYATGLLIVAVWSDTKKLNYRLWQHKTYHTTIDLSQSSDTRDLQYRQKYQQYPLQDNGIVVDGKYKIWPSLDEINSMLQSLIPQHFMPVPAFSAKKIKWAHSYDLARSGTLIQQHKMMTFDTIQVLSYHFPTIQLEVTVWSGTYIRSLAYRIGTQYEMGGLLTSLRRICIWPVHVPTHNTHGDDKLIIGEIILS